MEGEVSLGQVVQTIMESLSEAISQLILFVIAMQESNSQMPPHIPQASEGVTTASNTLADVASSLAEEEYDGYPDIQLPIIEAAKDVRQSGVVLIDATNNLKNSPDRAEGWARLLDACRVISGQTCYILQLVYGAELKRIEAALAAAKDLAGQTQAALAAANPQKFADQVSELAGQAEALADSLYDKLKEEESPLRREEMKKSADNLKVYSDDLPRLANDVLKNPRDPKPHVPFDNKVRDVVKEVDNIAAPIKEKLKMLPSKPPKIEPTGVPQRRKDPPTKAAPPFTSQAASAPPPRGPPPPTVFPPQAVKSAKDDVRALFAAKDPNGVAIAAHQLADDISPIVEHLENLAKASHDPERQHALRSTANNIKAFAPKAVAAAAQGLKDPKPNAAELGKVAQQVNSILDFAQEVAKPAPEVEAAAIAKALLVELPKMEAAASQPNQKELETAAKKISDLLPFLRQPTKDLIERHSNPKTKAKLTEALKKVEEAVPESIQAAKAAAKNVNHAPTREKLANNVAVAEEALRDIIENCGVEVLADIRKQNDDVASLDVLALLEEPKQVAAVEKTIVQRQPKIAEKALGQAEGAPDAPLAKAEITKEVQLLDQLLPEQVKLAQELVNKPSADAPKKKLKQNTQEMGKVLDNIAADVQKIPPQPSRPKKKPEGKLASVQDLIDALAAAKGPGGEEHLQHIFENITPALEKWLEEVPEKTEEEVKEEKIEDLGEQLIELVEKLADAAPVVKDPKQIEPFTKPIPPKVKEFVEAVKPFIDNHVEDEEVKALLQDALDDLSALAPELLSAANDVAKNPRDPRLKKKLDDLADAGNKNVKFIIKKINRTPEEKKADAIRKFPKGVKRVLDALDNNGEDLKGALDRLKKVIRDMNPPKKDDSPDYTAGRNIAAAIAELEKQLAEKNKKPGDKNIPHRPFNDAKNVFEKLANDVKEQPKPDPAAEIIAKVQDLNNLIDRLEAAAAGPNPDPKKLVNLSKAIASKLEPLVKQARKEAEGIKDPKQRKQVEAALEKLEKEVPRLINEGVKPFIQNPTPENKEKLVDAIQNLRPPLDDISEVFRPDAAVDTARKEKQGAARLANAAKRGDPKAAEEALRAIKDNQNKLSQAAKQRAAQAPPKIKEHIEQKIKELEDKVKALDPAVQNLAKKPNDPNAKQALVDLAEDLAAPLDSVIEDLEFAPVAARDELDNAARQILACIRAKNIKKIDPSNLLKISKHLAGLLSDMVSKTGQDLQSQSNLSDRARAALELEKLLSQLEKDAARNNPSSTQTQSIEELLKTLNFAGGSGGSSSQPQGAQTQLSQQIASVAKEIKAKTTANGSIEGTPLHQISQSLAADLQKFADADSGNSRSELIVLGRSISANIVRLADELKRLAAACTDPKRQDQLLRNSQVLRNYATQLKIMASVRAASPKTQDSSSDQLVVLTQNLAAVIGDATNAVSIMKQTKTGRV